MNDFYDLYFLLAIDYYTHFYWRTCSVPFSFRYDTSDLATLFNDHHDEPCPQILLNSQFILI